MSARHRGYAPENSLETSLDTVAAEDAACSYPTAQALHITEPERVVPNELCQYTETLLQPTPGFKHSGISRD